MSTGGDQPRPGEFALRLQAWRQKQGWTQAELAKRLGYSPSYIAKLLAGDRKPSRAFLASWSLATGQSEDTLLRGPIRDIARPALPNPPSVMIGREDDLESLVGLLIGRARCVTLVGPPGIGKTRLAMAAAERLDSILEDGVWWVGLLDVTATVGVGQQMRREFQLPDRPNSDPVDAVLRRLSGQEALVVLDNFEHVMDARPVVTRLVEGSPTKVLVTSREALGLVSEQVFPVPPLRFPDPATQPTFEEVLGSPAVQLFVARAQMASPQFRLTPSNYRAVLAACAGRDGAPLGIVLAAGGLKTLDPAGLAARLEQVLDLPGVAPSDMPEHHAGWDPAISWSWDLLTTDEQGLLASLAAFSGGFTVAAVAAVNNMTHEVAEAGLTSLHGKSLVEARPDASSGPRFELLDTIRMYARKQLERAGHLEETRQEHVAYYVGFAETCGRRHVGPDQAGCAQAFADDFENLRRAFELALEVDPASALRIAASLWRCFLLGDIPTGRRWLDQALTTAPAATPARARALAGAGAMGWISGDAELAARALHEAAALSEELGLDDVDALVSVNLGALAEQQGRLNDAEEHFTSALAVYDQLGDRRGRAVALNGLGMIWRRRGDLDRAWPMWTEAASLFQAVGDGTNEALALGNKAWCAETEGRLDEAELISHECLRIQIALGDARGLALTTFALGRLAFRRGALAQARSMQLDALKAFHARGDLPWAASTLLALGAVAEADGSCDQAIRLVAAAGAVWEQIEAPPREEDRELRDEIVARCRDALGATAYERAVADGRALTLRNAILLASDGPPPEGT